MDFKTPGQHKTIQSFRSRWQEVAPELGCDLEVTGAAGPLGRPLTVGGRMIGNRWAIHPLEGWDCTADGLPTEHTLRRWSNFGASGAKLIWGGEAFAVRADGRANPNQLYHNREVDSLGGLERLREAVVSAHSAAGEGTDDLCIGLQLTHSGRYARPSRSGPAPRIAYRHPVLDARSGIESDAAIFSDAELDSLLEDFAATACLAQEAGFDFVDVKCCHGYLLHELLGARTRPGAYGGSFENRTRFFRRAVRAIRGECPGFEIGVRVSVGDVFPHSPGEDRRGEPTAWEEHLPYDWGFGMSREDPRRVDLTEGLRFLEVVRDLGIALVNVTLGVPYYSPHLSRPAAYPPSDGYQPPGDPLIEVAEHLRAVRACKRAFGELALVGTGYTYLQEWLPNVAQHEVGGGHVDFVGVGRMVLSYPELPLDVLRGRPLQRRKICRTFSDCTTGPRNGLRSGCYPLDDFYRQGPEAERLREIKERL